MWQATMMAFSMHFLKRSTFEGLLRSIWLVLLIGVCDTSHAQVQVEIAQFHIDRSGEELSLTAHLQFELSGVVEEALLKGVPVFFRADAEILKERWYWYDRSIVAVTRHYKLAYQPLTRRWRVSVGNSGGGGQGLALGQGYDSLSHAIDSVKRITKWRIAALNDIEPSGRYRLDFRFQLDVAQLPRPFQIGVLGQSDWDINIVKSLAVAPESGR